MGEYEEFIAGKNVRHPKTGFMVEPEDLNPNLFDWQRQVVRWSLGTGRAALLEECGLGKSFQQLEYARKVNQRENKPILLLCPLAVQWQTMREAERFAIDSDVKIVERQSDCINGINITNYEKLDHFDPSEFVGVVLDECFAKGTQVDTPSGSKSIEDLREGDKIINAFGVDVVSDVHRREVEYAIKVRCRGKEVIASPNHPWFTERGWVASQDLEPGDRVLSAVAAMRVLRNGISSSSISSERDGEVLREILLSEMADASTGTYCEGALSGSCGEARCSEAAMVCCKQPKGSCGEKADCSIKSDVQSRSKEEGEPHIESDGASTFRSWRKRKPNDASAVDIDGCVGEWVGSRVERIVGPANSRLSNMLQSGLRKQRAESCYRGGWTVASGVVEENAGRKESEDAEFAWVESIEVLEQGHPELERLRSPDGKLYFYDLGGTRHPSYSVAGCLVHNSSILKAYTSKTKRQLCEAFSNTQYRLACTATPAPNDRMELGNHSEFLSVMPSNEMLARWFINDGAKVGSYRLCKHGEDDFWRWMASWSMCLSSPADIGFDASGYVLPELRTHEHIVESKPHPGCLFVGSETISATQVHKEKRAALAERADIAASLVNADSDYWVVWCDTDYEADALLARIPCAVEVRGSHSASIKTERLRSFAEGRDRVLITKAEVAGFGLNFQHCHKTTWFAGYSYERWYQAIRRLWRFGQINAVDVHLIRTEREQSICDAINRKHSSHLEMAREMAKLMHAGMLEEIGLGRSLTKYNAAKRASLPSWISTKG